MSPDFNTIILTQKLFSMINNVLLISEDFVKTNSNISDNMFGKFLLPAIREAQHIRLQSVIGTRLYESLLQKVTANTLTEQYKELVDDYVQWFLLYQVLSDVIDIIDVKFVNMGTVRNRDEYVDNISDNERVRLKHNYEYKADWYCKQMQEYLLNNRQQFEELDDCACSTMKANLKSAASTGIWLGGFRGKIVR